MSNTDKIAERLVAHARLCRQIAEATFNEDAAHKLNSLATECLQAATTVWLGQKPKIEGAAD